MKIAACSICDKSEIPLNDTIKINGNILCADCFNSKFPDKKDLKGVLVEKEFDPTICSSCSKDFENLELNKISTYPICEDCEIKIKNRTFPTWVKGVLTAILLIVVFSFFWNWKYYEAFREIKKSNAFFEKEDFNNASNSMKSASKKVPEVEEIGIMATYFRGLDLLVKDKSAEALVELNQCKDKMPPNSNINSLIIQAKIGSSFDNKDYEGFLAASKESLDMDSTKAVSWASVASAYACIYADKGTDDAKMQADNYIAKAKKIDSTSKEMKEYYNIIDYRIQSREIIKREEFIKRFPNGWTKN